MATVRLFTPSVRVRSAGSLRKARNSAQPALFENLEPRLFLSAGGLVQADALAADAGGTMNALLDAGPAASDLAYTINKNATFPFTRAIFTGAFSDPDHLSLSLVEIASLPESGTLRYKGQGVTLGQLIPASQLGSLSYVIAKGYDGADSFTWRASNGTVFTNVATAEFVTTPEATIVSGGDALEGRQPGFFTVEFNHAALGDVRINLGTGGHAVGGKNYVRMPSFVTIPAGVTSVEVALTPLFDGVAKGDLDVIEKIGPGRGYTVGQAGSASVLIVDDEPKISFTTSAASIQWGSAAGQVTVSHSGANSGATDDYLTLTLMVAGTARGGKDYQALPQTMTIPAGTTTIAIVPLLNPAAEKTVTVTCQVNSKAFSLDPRAKSAVEYLEPGLLLTSAASLFRPAVAYTVGFQPDAVAVGDFNHDGKTDLVAVNASSTLDPGTMSILLGKGDGTFQDAVSIATDIDATAVVVGRFNDDAFDDIAVACYDSASGGSSSVIDIFLGNGNGTFQPKTSFATPSTPVSIALADFNGDGFSDLAVASEEGDNDLNLSIYLADSGGSGALSPKATYPAYWAEGVTAGDFDEDGNMDLAVINQQDSAHQGNPTVAIFAGAGDGTFQAGASYAVGDGAASVTSVDLNGDGHLDLAIPCYNASNVGILLGDGDGTFGARTDFGALLDPQGVATGDLDNDGQMDLAIAEWGDSAVRLKLGNGAGGFRTIDDEEVDAGNGPKGIVTADFNGDGRLDVAATDQQASTVSVLLGTGPTALDLAYTISKNATFRFTKAIFAGAFSDPNHLPLAQVKIGSLPGHGTLLYKGLAVGAGQVIPAAQLGSLSYVIAKGYDGVDSFAWRACDGVSYSTPATVKFVTTPEAWIGGGFTATEGGQEGRFAVRLNHPALTDVTINLATAGRAVGGKNYAKMPSFVTIPAGQTSAEFALTPTVDGVAKGDLDVIEKIGPGRGYTVGQAGAASALIVDDEPKISFTTPSASIQWGGDAGQVIVTRCGATDSDLILTLVIGGTARNGVDYQLLPTTVTIPAGSSSTTIAIVPLLDPATLKAVTLSCKVDTKVFSLDPLAKSVLVEILHG
jgi:hypothetical protein